jgi:hypothetical protein
MKSKDKAKQLVDKMYVGFIHSLYSYKAKQCAIIAVDEIIKALNDDIYIQGETDIDSHKEYWQEVKIEIEKL